MKQIILLLATIVLPFNIYGIGVSQLTDEWYDLHYSNRIAREDNNLWLATSMGIIKYDKITDEIYNASMELGIDFDAEIAMVSVTPQGDLLFTDKQKGTYIRKGETIEIYKEWFYELFDSERLFSFSCAYDELDSLWLTSNCGVQPYFELACQIPYPGQYRSSECSNSKILSTITDIAFDSKGNLWAAIYGEYEHLLCKKKEDRYTSNALESVNGQGGTKEICSIVVDKNDNIWFAAEDGIHCYYQETGKDSTMSNVTHLGIPNEQFLANDIDENNNIWFSSSTTLMKYNGNEFTTYSCDGYQEACAILCDGDVVWVLLKNDKLLKFQNNEFETINLSSAVNDVEYKGSPRGIDLREYAFGIPAEQLNFNNQTPFTFSFWVNIKEFNHNTQGTQFLNIRNPNINDNMDKGGGYPLCDWGYLFSTIQEYGVDDYGGIWKDNELLVSVREQTASSSSPFVREKTFKFSSGKWFFVTFQQYYTDKPQMKLYVNGDEILKFTSESILMDWYKQYIIMIGGAAAYRSPLNAYVDKVQFYNRALTQKEIQTSMYEPLLNDESLLGYWDFENGCTTDTEGYMMADKGTIKATMYYIIRTSELSMGTEIKQFKFEKGVDLESVLQGVEEHVADVCNTKAYVSDGVLYIENAEGINTVIVYDAMGRTLLTPNPSPVERGATYTQIELPSTLKGVIMVKVNNEVVKVICE